MIDFDTAQLRSHRRNIERYCRLLATDLTDLERQYLHKRIADEHAQLKQLEKGKESGKRGSSANLAPATDDSSVERSDELFAELRPIFLRLTPTDKRAAQRLPLSVVIRRQLCGQILIGPEGLPTQVDVELTQVRSVAHITLVGGPGVFGLHLERLVRRLDTC